MVIPEDTEVQGFIIFLREHTGPNWYLVNLFSGMVILLHDEISYLYSDVRNFRVQETKIQKRECW